MKMFTVEMPNGDIWGVPVDMIARNRAKHYAHEFDGDVERSLVEDTLPLFDEEEYEIEDWAVNNMNWSDFDGHQVKLRCGDETDDFQEAWLNGPKDHEDVTDIELKAAGYVAEGG
jgi:hypothetical protein